MTNVPTQAQSSSRKRSWWKRLLFGGLMLAWMLILLEIVSGLFWWTWKPEFTWRDQRDQLESLRAGGSGGNSLSEAIHPYLGWVLNPDLHNAKAGKPPHQTANELGFVDDGHTLYRRQPDRVLIGICGGSVAQQMSWFGADELKQKLLADPAYVGKEIQFVRLAMSGYKQPQQLMSLSYLLALGGELDILINVDGYNEFALALCENREAAVSMAYPRLWHARLQNVVDPRATSVSYRLFTIRAKRQQCAQFLDRPILRDSRMATLIWLISDLSLQARQRELQSEILKRTASDGHGFTEDGPRDHFTDTQAADARAMELWKNSSTQLARLCRANGIRYMHVLQPNQYHEGSKTLSEEERKDKFDPDQSLGHVIKRLYPQAIQEGAALRRQGIHFVDATRLFADIPGTIYSDYFCHYTREGSVLLAAAVAEALLQKPPEPEAASSLRP